MDDFRDETKQLPVGDCPRGGPKKLDRVLRV
jgi:hypothetical protein